MSIKFTCMFQKVVWGNMFHNNDLTGNVPCLIHQCNRVCYFCIATVKVKIQLKAGSQ